MKKSRDWVLYTDRNLVKNIKYRLTFDVDNEADVGIIFDINIRPTNQSYNCRFFTDSQYMQQSSTLYSHNIGYALENGKRGGGTIYFKIERDTDLRKKDFFAFRKTIENYFLEKKYP